MKKRILLLFLTLLIWLGSTWGLSAAQAASHGPDYLPALMEYMLLGISLVVVLAAIISMAHVANVLLQAQKIRLLEEQGIPAEEVLQKVEKESLWSRFYKRATDNVPLDKEDEIMFDHEYDGIRELDNSLPPWWVWMFYATIFFAVVYLGYYHVLGYGMSSSEEYAYEMERAEEAVKAALAGQANLVDETNVVVMTDEMELSLGQSIYELNCSVCHGKGGEGLVGPNFADQYWIHGGSIQDIFKVIKYGVPEKGMISWKSQLKPVEMQRVASYILTFQGTNPPNQKAAEGELYQPSASSEGDSLNVSEAPTPGQGSWDARFISKNNHVRDREYTKFLRRHL